MVVLRFTTIWLLRDVAFLRNSLRESLVISAVVVDHVVLLRPFQPLLARAVQLLRQPFGGRGIRS
ncbi:unnamed protein product [Linum tenue]|uniref:Secreted protein n=1 Tax=Linum tenue TaxID=586396 RepID=A0AAV0GSG8_9ROSI|nr:unnamed protein product [Linum tenue]